MDKDLRHIPQFRAPVSNEQTLWIVIAPLFDRVVDPDCIDRGAPRLHLALAPMDARLVIHKLACQMQAALPPWQPKVVASKRHQHRSHAEVDPTVGSQGPHTGIHKRHSGAPLRPGLKLHPIKIPKTAHQRMKVLELNRRFVFQFLNEMAMPVKARPEAVDAAAFHSSALLKHLTHREASPGEVGRQA